MPRRVASVGEPTDTGRPSNRYSPSSPGWIPAIALISVDLPAPLSPTRATTSPASTSKSTPVRASTAPKRLLTPRASRSRFGTAGPLLMCCLLLLDAVLRAGRLVRGGADLGHGVVLVLDDRVLDLRGR